MFSEVTFYVQVTTPTKYIENKEPVCQRNFLATHVLNFLLNNKSTEKHGYFLTVTTIKTTGKEEKAESCSCHTYFSMSLTCRIFRPCAGETMLGVVYDLKEYGAWLRCGPMRLIYLSVRKMAGFRYSITGKNPAFINNSLSRIEVDVVVRFIVLDVKWVEKEYSAVREFKVLASLEGDSLGPVSLSGSDELDLW